MAVFAKLRRISSNRRAAVPKKSTPCSENPRMAPPWLRNRASSSGVRSTLARRLWAVKACRTFGLRLSVTARLMHAMKMPITTPATMPSQMTMPRITSTTRRSIRVRVRPDSTTQVIRSVTPRKRISPVSTGRGSRPTAPGASSITSRIIPTAIRTAQGELAPARRFRIDRLKELHATMPPKMPASTLPMPIARNSRSAFASCPVASSMLVVLSNAATTTTIVIAAKSFACRTTRSQRTRSKGRWPMLRQPDRSSGGRSNPSACAVARSIPSPSRTRWKTTTAATITPGMTR